MDLIRWVNEACVRQGATLFNGGLDVQRAIYYTMIPGVTGCVECWMHQVQSQDPISRGLLEERQRLQIGGENAAFVPLVTLVGGLMLSEFGASRPRLRRLSLLGDSWKYVSVRWKCARQNNGRGLKIARFVRAS